MAYIIEIQAKNPHTHLMEWRTLHAQAHSLSKFDTRERAEPINAIRAHLAEFWIVAPVGRNGVEELLDVVVDSSDKRLPEIAHGCLAKTTRDSVLVPA